MSVFADAVRDADPDRYFSALYAPEAARADLFALYAFDAEVSSIRAKVSTPMLGEIRLQWWRDALENREGQGNPLADAVIALMARCDLPMQALLDLLEARIFDLYNDPFPTQNDLEGYAGETRGRILMLAGAVLAPEMPQTGPTADAAGHGGVALLLRDMLVLDDGALRQGPTDLLTRHTLSLDSADGLAEDGLRAARQDLADAARAHLAAFQLAAATLPVEARPAFMPVALAQLDLMRLASGKTRPAPLWRRLWALRRVAKKGFS